MKPKEYVKKYKLTEKDSPFNHSDFVADLSSDFLATIEYLREAKQLNYSRFETVGNEIRHKFDSIRRQSTLDPQAWEKIWSYFYATVFVKARDELFGEYLRKQRQQREQRRQEEYEFYRQGFSWEDILFGFLQGMQQSLVPTDDFTRLGLSPGCSEEDVTKSFRALAMTHHPDKGGDHATFVQIIESKNKCIAYLRGSH